MQSGDRYGINVPAWDRPTAESAEVEAALYNALTGSLAVQEALQQATLKGGIKPGDLTLHVSELSPPELQSPDYAKLLEEKAAKKILPHVHAVCKLIPHDQYFLHFHSIRSANELMDLTNQWGTSLLRLVTIRAQDNRLQAKLD